MKTVADLVKHLQTLPQDLEIMQLCDEAGTYHEMKEMPKVQDVVKSNNALSYDGTQWTDDHGWGGWEDDDDYEVYERKTVVTI